MRRFVVCLMAGVFLTMLPPAALAATGSVRVQVTIDGLSDLSLSGNTAQWRHIAWSPPGLTTINGVGWTPSGLSSFCDCLSDLFTGVAPPIPQEAWDFALTQSAGRVPVTIAETPVAANGYSLRLRFDDSGPGGADDYDVVVSYQYGEPVPTASSMLLAGLALVICSSGLILLRRR